MWDTTKDYRLLVAEKAVELFLRTVEGANLRGKWNKKKALSSARDMVPEIQALYYTYLDPADLAQTPPLNSLEKQAEDIVDALGGQSWYQKFLELVNKDEKEKLEDSIARIKFFLNIISGLKRRLSLGEINDPIIGIDIKNGLISSVGKHPRAERLMICNVNLGNQVITVVTNDLGVREGDRVAVALLPPAGFQGITSEGMFLGAGEGVLKDVEGELGGLPQKIPLDSFNEARNFVDAFLK